MNRIAFTLEELQQKIEKTCNKRQIFQDNVRLIAVSKRQTAEKIKKLALRGQSEFAENQVQEAIDKIETLSDLALSWHFIGAIQSRKCRQIAQNFDWVQSVDRVKLVHKLDQARSQLNDFSRKPLNVCIQVNLFNEPQKSGADKETAFELAEMIESTENLKLRGIMALPPKQIDAKLQRLQFDEIRSFYTHLAYKYPKIDTLSMGMSVDFDQAILAGSTMIRVGTSLFGERQ